MIAPLHVATVGGQQLRFFRTPLDDGRPDLPWHAVEDLHRALGLKREGRRFFLQKLREWKGPRTVATADGVVTVAPDFMAQATIDAMVEEGMAPVSVCAEYEDAITDAALLVIPHPFPSDGWLLWMRDAANRWERWERAP